MNSLEINYKRNARYFRGQSISKNFMQLLIVVAVFSIFTAIGTGNIVWAVPAIIIAMFLISMILAKPSDSEIDSQLDALAVGLKEEALMQLGLDEEETQIAPPLFLKGYSLGRSVLNDVEGGNPLSRRVLKALRDVVGKDGYWRSPECVVTAWFFVEDQILQYSKIVSLIAPTFKSRTKECAYKDVVSLQTEVFERPRVDPKTGKVMKGKVARSMSFAICNAGGETIWCTSKDPDEAQNSVNAMRSLIRQKKMS